MLFLRHLPAQSTINNLKKYLFGLVVSAYIVMTVGIPVYLHYCGGELEEISYLLKADSCCGGEDDHSDEGDGGCCEDEGLFLKSTTDFTLKEFKSFKIPNTWNHLTFNTTLPQIISFTEADRGSPVHKNFIPPAKLYSGLIISTSVLRI